MRNVLGKNAGIRSFVCLLLVSAPACGGDDSQTSSDESAQSMPAMSTAGGTSASTGGSGSARTTARGSAGNAARSGSAATRGNAGAGASQQASSEAGSGAAGMLDMGDEDAGVAMQAPPAGQAGATGVAGSAAAAGGGAAGVMGAAGMAGSGAVAGSGGSAAASATFTEVYALFTASCAGATCHVASNFPAGMLSMSDKATAYMNLVGVNASACPGEKRVVPGEPDKSELLHALAHTQIGDCADTPRMPDDQPQLPQSDIDLVSSWIMAGALNN